MICPVCNSPLHQSELVNHELDSCRMCRGIWFDSGELGPVALALSRHADEPEFRLQKSILKVKDVDEAARECPRCRITMNKLNYAGDSNVILDKCRQCGGVWCDGPEIERLIKYVKGREDLTQMGRGVLRHAKQMQTLADLQDLGDSLRQRAFRGAWYVLPWIVPLGDCPATYGFPWVVAGLLLTNVLVFAWQVTFVPEAQTFFEAFGLVPMRILSGERLPTLVTSMFVHAGIWHLAGNMIYLWIFGDNIEESLGRARFLLFYLGVGMLAILPHVALFPTSSIPLVGASGAISGVLGAYFVLHPRSQIRLLILGHLTHLPAWFALAAWFGLQLIFGAIALWANSPCRIAWLAHIGGFAFGAILAFGWSRKQRSVLVE